VDVTAPVLDEAPGLAADRKLHVADERERVRADRDDGDDVTLGIDGVREATIPGHEEATAARGERPGRAARPRHRVRPWGVRAWPARVGDWGRVSLGHTGPENERSRHHSSHRLTLHVAGARRSRTTHNSKTFRKGVAHGGQSRAPDRARSDLSAALGARHRSVQRCAGVPLQS
jgi:hypothetical protein